MGYTAYGISKELVNTVKQRMKNPAVKEKVKAVLADVTKQDLQNRVKVRRLIGVLSAIVGVKINDQMAGNMTSFVIDQKIDPNNMFHLMKLWGMFR